MPIWSFEELLAIKGTMAENEAAFRFVVVGGSARNFLMIFPRSVHALPIVQDIMNWISRGTTWEADFQDTFDGYCRAISQELSDVDESDTGESAIVFNSLMRHSVDGLSVWASTVMRFIGAEISKCQDDKLWITMRNLLTTAGTGYLFESLVHRKFSSSGFTCSLQPLHKKVGRKADRKLVPLTLGHPIVLFRQISDIKNLKIDQYGLPCIDNFPLVDSVMQPCNLFQVTVSPCSHKGNVSVLQDMRSQLLETDPSKHRMIFVVPRANLKTFQYQEDLGDIAQFVTSTETVTSENVLHPIKKSKSSSLRRGVH